MPGHTHRQATIPSRQRRREIVSTRTGLILIALLVAAGAGIVTFWPYQVVDPLSKETEKARSSGPTDGSESVAANASPPPAPWGRSANTNSEDIPAVEANRSPEVRRGFPGEVHPLLHGQTRLQVAARWSAFGKRLQKAPVDADFFESVAEVLYREAKPARGTQRYTEQDFSGFLPERVEAVGQIWELDGKRVIAFLRQFHAGASLHLAAPGRRAGPDGAFGILRAISPSYLDIVCRIHAEFNVTPKANPTRLARSGAKPDAPVTAWYTPAFFSGRMIVNRNTGTVDYFHLGIPTDKSLNTHLTVSGLPDSELHFIVRVEQMELTGGDGKLVDAVHEPGAIDLARAQDQLASQFYKFKDIDWVPLDKALATARQYNKPILAMITWGSLDDQSC
jgi:hypothetical protein